MSLNRPTVKDGSLPGWGAEGYYNKWNEFYKSEVFKIIRPSFNEMVKGLIEKLNLFYEEEYIKEKK